MKRAKSLAALLLGMLLLFSFAACGDSSSSAPAANNNETPAASETAGEPAGQDSGEEAPAAPEGKYPAEAVKIGVVTFDTTADQFLEIQRYFSYLSENINVEFIYSESLDAAEGELAFIESCAAAGCDAIYGYYNIARIQSVQLAIDLGMYYVGVTEEDDVYEAFKENDMYLGGYYNENMDYASGYAIGTGLVEAGCEKVVFASGGRDFGIQMFIDRSAGFYAAIEDAQAKGVSIEVTYDVSGWPGTDAYSSDQAAALETGADGVASSFGGATWLQPIANSGRDIKLASVDSLVQMFIPSFESGTIVTLSVEQTAMFGIAIPLVINAKDGNLVRDENGYAPRIPVERLDISSAGDYASYVEYETNGTWMLNAADMLDVIKGYNPDASYEDLCELYMAMSIEEIDARRAAQA